jgi:hypothetical protein
MDVLYKVSSGFQAVGSLSCPAMFSMTARSQAGRIVNKKTREPIGERTIDYYSRVIACLNGVVGNESLAALGNPEARDLVAKMKVETLPNGSRRFGHSGKTIVEYFKTFQKIIASVIDERGDLSGVTVDIRIMFSSSVRQPIFKVACQLTHVGCVAESLQNVFCGFDVDAQSLADLVLHLEHQSKSHGTSSRKTLSPRPPSGHARGTRAHGYAPDMVANRGWVLLVHGECGRTSLSVTRRTGRKRLLPRRQAFAIWAPHAGGPLPMAKPSPVHTKSPHPLPHLEPLLRAG